MNAQRILLAGLLVSLSAFTAWALDKHDSIGADGTEAIALTSGDLPNTYQVAVDSFTGTVLRAAVTNRSRRRVCFQNSSAVYKVAIGSSTTYGATNQWVLGESTNTATSPEFCSNNSGAFSAYITSPYPAAGNAVTVNVNVLEEKASQDSGTPY